MSKILGLDYGEKRIGMAISDDEKRMAVGVDVLENIDENTTFLYLKNFCQKEEIEKIVVGLPLNLSGKETKKTIEVQKFSIKLEDELGLPVEFQDERLTSKEIEKLLKGVKKEKGQIDRQAARLILQSYLDGIILKNLMTEEPKN